MFQAEETEEKCEIQIVSSFESYSLSLVRRKRERSYSHGVRHSQDVFRFQIAINNIGIVQSL